MIILYSYKRSWHFDLFEAKLNSPGIKPIAEQDAASGKVTILSHLSLGGTKCTSLTGEGGDEEVECNSGVGVFTKFEGMKELLARNDDDEARFAGAGAFASPSRNDITCTFDPCGQS